MDGEQSLIGADGLVDLGEVRERFVRDAMDGSLSPELSQILDIKPEEIYFPPVPSVLIDLGDDDPVDASQRCQLLPALTLPPLGTLNPPETVRPFVSDSDYQDFRKDYGENLEQWGRAAQKILASTLELAKNSGKMTASETSPYIVQIPQIRFGHEYFSFLFAGIRHCISEKKRKYNALLKNASQTSDLTNLTESEKLEVKGLYSEIELLTFSEEVKNIRAVLYTFNDLLIHYNQNIPLSDNVSHLERVYLQHAYYVRGLLISRGFNAQKEDLKAIESSQDARIQSIALAVKCAGFVDSVTKNSFDLLAYFGARSGIAKILKNFHYQLWAKSEEGNATGSTTVQGYMKYLAQLPKPIFKAMNVFEKTYTRRSVAYYTISPKDRGPYSFYGTRVKPEEVKEIFKLAFKTDLASWFCRGVNVRIGSPVRVFIKFNMSFDLAATQEIKDYYQKIIDHHAKNFTDYLLQLGWEASHHVMP